MSLSALGHYWLFWSVPLCVAGLVSLLVVIVKLVNKLKSAELFSVPLAGETIVEFGEPGKVQLHVAGPRFTGAFAGLGYELTDLSDGRNVPMSVSLPLRSSGLGEVRVARRKFAVARPGRYALRVSGLRADGEHAGCRIVFARPYTLYVLLSILGMVASGGALIVGVVMSLIYLSGAKR